METEIFREENVGIIARLYSKLIALNCFHSSCNFINKIVISTPTKMIQETFFVRMMKVQTSWRKKGGWKCLEQIDSIICLVLMKILSHKIPTWHLRAEWKLVGKQNRTQFDNQKFYMKIKLVGEKPRKTFRFPRNKHLFVLCGIFTNIDFNVNQEKNGLIKSRLTIKREIWRSSFQWANLIACNYSFYRFLHKLAYFKHSQIWLFS